MKRALFYQYGQWVEEAHTEYQYDTNNIDPYVSEYAAGRLAAVTHGRTTYLYGYTKGGLTKTKQMRDGGLDSPLTGSWAYDDEGKLTSITYPSGSVYTYGYDSMGRPNTLSGVKVAVNGAQYNAAGQPTRLDYAVPYWNPSVGTLYQYYTETRQYNEAQQLTRQTGAGPVWDTGGLPNIDLEYRYAAGQNNGRIAQAKDWISGEEVSYTYDSLNRLIAAATTGPEWGTSYTYDGFGNLTAKTVTKGTAPSWSNAVNPATNLLLGYAYDAAGNQGEAADYDSWSRYVPHNLTEAMYGYDAYNKRVWRRVGSSQEEIVYYGIDGRKMETYLRQISGGVALQSVDVYFAGRLIVAEGRPVITDRLGSVRGDVDKRRYDYYPYGEERTSTPSERTKFGTYFRDSSGLDYADQRYYASVAGRFWSPDPYQASAGPADPGSWNRYAYVLGDPVNYYDARGLDPTLNNNYTPDYRHRSDPGSFEIGAALLRFLMGGDGVFGFKNTVPAEIMGTREAAGLGLNPASLREQSNMLWQGRLQSAIAGISAHCSQAFRDAKIDTANIALAGSAIQFWDATQDNLLIGEIVRNSPAATIRLSEAEHDSGGKADALVIPMGLPNGSTVPTANVVLFSGFFKSNPLAQNATPIHEATHVATGKGDLDLAHSFGFGGTDAAEASKWLGGFFRNDCTEP